MGMNEDARDLLTAELLQCNLCEGLHGRRINRHFAVKNAAGDCQRQANHITFSISPQPGPQLGEVADRLSHTLDCGFHFCNGTGLGLSLTVKESSPMGGADIRVIPLLELGKGSS
jgi:hypothetical protein